VVECSEFEDSIGSILKLTNRVRKNNLKNNICGSCLGRRVNRTCRQTICRLYSLALTTKIFQYNKDTQQKCIHALITHVCMY
jgi:hypothetical protein